MHIRNIYIYIEHVHNLSIFIYYEHPYLQCHASSNNHKVKTLSILNYQYKTKFLFVTSKWHTITVKLIFSSN